MDFAILQYLGVCSAIQYIHVSTFIQYAFGWGGGGQKRVLFVHLQKAENCGPPLNQILMKMKGNI